MTGIRLWKHFFAAGLFALLVIACGGGSSDPICNCQPTGNAAEDFRAAAKHVPLPPGAGIPITVATMLSWPQQPVPSNTAPRTGRENQLFTIAQGYVQSIWLQPTDCDLHFEVSDTPDKNAPRAIMETPRDDEYCPARKDEAAMMQRHGMQFARQRQEVPNPFPVTVTGLAFQDFPHGRGSKRVGTTWELHPAIVNGQ